MSKPINYSHINYWIFDYFWMCFFIDLVIVFSRGFIIVMWAGCFFYLLGI